MLHADICIAGAGIIGLSLALELERRGARVLIAEATTPLCEASTAAGGMLAVDDPENPPQILPLSRLSRTLYPDFLATIEARSGKAVPFQTHLTLQHYADHLYRDELFPTIDEITRAQTHHKLTRLLSPASLTDDRFHLLVENSIDPRQLAPALLSAVQRSPGIRLLVASPIRSTTSTSTNVRIETNIEAIEATHFVDCTGAWAKGTSSDPSFSIIPIKGQMLAVAIPHGLPLDLTIRTPDLYIIPRLHGLAAGRAILGATVEDAGFDKNVNPADITALRARAAQIIPSLAHAEIIDSWAGLRPASADYLPLIGPHPTRPRHFLATGHYRNGILLAPATAHVLAQIILNEQPTVDLATVSPHRFSKKSVEEATRQVASQTA